MNVIASLPLQKKKKKQKKKLPFKMEKSTHMFKFVCVQTVFNEIKTSYGPIQRHMQIGKVFHS